MTVYDNISGRRAFGNPQDERAIQFELSEGKNPKDPDFVKLTCEMLTPSLARAAESADVRGHKAGQVAVTTSLNDPRTNFEVNPWGTFNVLEAARLNDYTLISCSIRLVPSE